MKNKRKKVYEESSKLVTKEGQVADSRNKKKSKKETKKSFLDNKKVIIPIVSIIVIIVIISIALMREDGEANDGVTKLSFKESVSMDTINSLNGKKVMMTGYMSTLSPLDGKYIYLMNLPYQSCPFCIPNTTTLSNTIAIYAKSGNSFSFTDKPITVEGTLVTGNFTDGFGYNYKYKIENATIKDADIDKLSQNIKMYSAISQDGLLQEILSLVMQTDANIYYDEYGFNPEELKEVSISDIDICISKLSAISKTDYNDLIDNLKKLKEINEVVNKNIADKKYEENKAKQEDIYNIYDFIGRWINKYEL